MAPLLTRLGQSFGFGASSGGGPVKVTATGGSTVSLGGYKYHIFTTPNGPQNFVVSAGNETIDYCVVAGGGGGQYDYNQANNDLTISSQGSIFQNGNDGYCSDGGVDGYGGPGAQFGSGASGGGGYYGGGGLYYGGGGSTETKTDPVKKVSDGKKKSKPASEKLYYDYGGGGYGYDDEAGYGYGGESGYSAVPISTAVPTDNVAVEDEPESDTEYLGEEVEEDAPTQEAVRNAYQNQGIFPVIVSVILNNEFSKL